MQSHVKLLMVQETITNLQETSGKKKNVDYRPFVAMCLPSVLNRANKYPHVKHSDHTKTRQSVIQCTLDNNAN